MKTSLRLALPALLATLLPLPLMAQSPSPVFDSFSYQGRVTEANGALIGLNSPVSRKITIRIYDSATGGTLLFAEDQNGIIFNGEFSIVVGGGTTNTLPPPLHTLLSNAFAGTVPSNGYWLGVTVDDGTPTVDPEISPRQKILAAPFAVRAATADNLSAVSREIRLSDNKLFLSTGSDVNAALEMATAANPFGSTLAFGGGPLLYGGSGGVLGTKNTNGEKTALQWGQNNVTITDRLGINRAAAPTETLVVKQGSASQTSLFKVNKLDDTSLFSIDSTGLVSITENVLIAKNLTVTGTLTGNATTATTAKKLDATENSNLNSKPLYLANGSDQNALDYATIFTNNGSAFGPRLYGRDGGELGTYKDSLYAKALVWNRAGMVGIGTVTPSRAKLEVVGSVSTSNNNIGAYFNRDAAVNLSGGASAQNAAYNLSLYCSNNIVCDTLMAFSDARIKHIQGRSDGAADLATLTRIEITDYTHKDVVTKDSRPHKKVIAQQVETVYPQAVSRGTDVVPDIYQKAEFKDGWVKLATSLKVGERVRLIGEKEEAIHEVLEVRDGAFRTAFQPPTNEVFVYGREVKDFRSVDYDAIAMLNVSATQQVKKELDAEVTKRDAEIKELRAENATLQAALEKAQASFETRLAALEKALPESGAEGAVKTVSTSTQQPVVSAAN